MPKGLRNGIEEKVKDTNFYWNKTKAVLKEIMCNHEENIVSTNNLEEIFSQNK